MTGHRHSAKLDSACALLETLSNQATRPPPNCPRGVNKGIIANLTSQGWTHHSTTDDVHIFLLDDPTPSFPEPALSNSHPSAAAAGTGDYFGSSWPEQSTASLVSGTSFGTASGSGTSARTGGTGTGKGKARAVARGGLRSHEYITVRGEGWIEGDWREEDVAATIQSKGAREVWDPRFDGAGSEALQHLSRTDTLLKLHIRTSFVSHRDACLASTVRIDAERGIAWVATTSVEDALVPRSGPRTNVRLNGFCLRSSLAPPQFDPPPDTNSGGPSSSHPPTRPGHRRAKSSMSHALNLAAAAGQPQAIAPPLPTFEPGTMIKPGLARKTSSSFLGGGGAPLLSPGILSPGAGSGESLMGSLGRSAGRAASGAILAREGKKRMGYHVSFIAQASPGQNLPQTAVDELTLHLPLQVASINRYLSTHGFAPHIIRQGPGSGLSILEEFYCASTSTYRVAFRVAREFRERETKVRFHGMSFARGRFDVSVQQSAGEGEVEWRVEYDTKPLRPPAVMRQDSTHDAASGTTNGSKQQKPGNVHRKSSLSVLGSPPSPAEATLAPLASLTSTTPTTTLPADPASLPGPLGGCTIHLLNSSLAAQPPIVLTMTPNSEASRPPLDRMRKVSEALAQASRGAKVGVAAPECIEELLEGEEGELRVGRRLRAAQGVLERMRGAREGEGGQTLQQTQVQEGVSSPVSVRVGDELGVSLSPESMRSEGDWGGVPPGADRGWGGGERTRVASGGGALGLEGITED